MWSLALLKLCSGRWPWTGRKCMGSRSEWLSPDRLLQVQIEVAEAALAKQARHFHSI